MTTADYLVDTSALVRLMLDPDDRYGWGRSIQRGLIGVCDMTLLEFGYSAKSIEDRSETNEWIESTIPYVITPDGVTARAGGPGAAHTDRETPRPRSGRLARGRGRRVHGPCSAPSRQ